MQLHSPETMDDIAIDGEDVKDNRNGGTRGMDNRGEQNGAKAASPTKSVSSYVSLLHNSELIYF